MGLADNWIGATQLRLKLTQILAGLDDLEEPLTIIHRSKPIGILWGYERWKSLVGKLEDAEDLLAISEGG